MNRNQLALFHAVAKAGSITAAAAATRISQPAVSKQIAELEEALGVRLVERLPRGVRLTEAGAILDDYAGRWAALEQDAERAVEEYRGLKRGRLAIGASQTIGGYLLPGMLADFHRRFPEIELRVEIGNTEHVRDALLDGTLELGLTEGPLDSRELDSSVFYQDELVAIAPVGHRLLTGKPESTKDLLREPLIFREKGSGTRAVVEKALRSKGLIAEPFLFLSSPEAIKHAVAAGLGVAVVSKLIIDAELQAGTLGIIPLKDLRIPRPLHLQEVRSRAVSPARTRFVTQFLRGGVEG